MQPLVSPAVPTAGRDPVAENPHEREEELAVVLAEQFGIAAESLPAAERRVILRDLAEFPDLGAPAALDRIRRSCVVGETMLFRHRDQLLTIADLAPELTDLARPLRVWSAGCSTGEEVYSLAAMLERRGLRYRIWGTDLSKESLDVARRARYRRWSLRGTLPEDLAGAVSEQGQQVRIAARLSRHVSFAPLNLVQDPFPAGLDVVFCRNVLIYFVPEAIERFWERVRNSLLPGGILMLGPADPRPRGPGWTQERRGNVFIHRRVDEAEAAPGRSRPAPPARRSRERTSLVPARRERAGRAAREVASPRVPRRQRRDPVPDPPASRSGGSRVGRPGATVLAERLEQLRGRAGREPILALEELESLCRDHPLVVAAQVLLALVAWEAGHAELQLWAARRGCLLAPRAALPNLLLGDALARAGEAGLARIRFATVTAALDAIADPNAPLPYGDGLSVGQARRLIAIRLAELETQKGRR